MEETCSYNSGPSYLYLTLRAVESKEKTVPPFTLFYSVQNTGHVVTTGPQSTAKLDVVVVEGDFNNEDEDAWTEEEFESHIVKEREGKRPLLNGELQVMLKEGVGTLGELTFTDNSRWIRSRKFRLGVKGASGCGLGIRTREAKTDSFSVKDHTGELYKKHYPPALTDEVWRLEKIREDGSFDKRLSKAGIHTVEDFLLLIDRDSQKLRTILGRLASQISTVIQGKDKPTYAPNRDAGDMCVVLNAKDVCVTGRKLTDKFYR